MQGDRVRARRRRRQTAQLLASVAVLAALVAGCGEDSTGGASAEKGEQQKVRLGLMPYQDYLTTVAFGIDKGWFAEEGLDVEYRIVDWYTDANEALASKSVDIASSTLDSRIAPAKTFTAAKQFMLGYSYEGFGMVTRPGEFKTYSDYIDEGKSEEEAVTATMHQLKGKTVLFPADGSPLVLVTAALKEAGLTLDDIEVIDIDVDQGLTAYLGGQGDAYLGGTPQRTKAVKEGSRVLIDATNLPSSAIELAGFAATDEFVDEHPDALVKFMKVWYRGVQYVRDNPEEAYDTIAKVVNEAHGTEFITADDMGGIWNKVEFFPEDACKAQEYFYDDGAPRYWSSSFDAVNQVYVESGDNPSPVAADKVLALDTFQEKLLSESECE